MITDYKLRFSNKARYLQLRVNAQGVEVIVPASKKVSEHTIQQFVTEKRQWIDRTLKKFSALNLITEQPKLPNTIHLAALNQFWQVQYCPAEVSKKQINLIIKPGHQLILVGNVNQFAQCQLVLINWLKNIAKDFLAEQLAQYTKLTGLSYNKLTIRINRSRWGSCSIRKNINLCAKLLFLPPTLVKHIILHELCHTHFMNHGRSFWRLLTKLDENTKQHIKLIKDYEKIIPLWIHQ